MTSILDNELVRKYFGCPGPCNESYEDCRRRMAFDILSAMQEPIRKGERFLAVNGADIAESVCGHEIGESLHTNCLRLPDRFQSPEKKECCEFSRIQAQAEDGRIFKLCRKHFNLITQPPPEKSCCAYHADHPQSQSACSDDIEPGSSGR